MAAPSLQLLSGLAARTWGSGAPPPTAATVDAALVARLFDEHLSPDAGADGGARAASALEASAFLERYLLPSFDAALSSNKHVLAICALVAEKHREGLPTFAAFAPPRPLREDGSRAQPEPAAAAAAAAAVSALFARVLVLLQQPLGGTSAPSLRSRGLLLSFLVRAFQSLEDDSVRRSALRIVSLPMWLSVSPTRVELELARYPALRRPWSKVLKDRDALREAAAVCEPLIFASWPPASEASGVARAGSSSKRRRSEIEDAASSSAPVHFAHVPADAAAFAHLQRRLDVGFVPALLAQFFQVLEAIPGPNAAAAADGAADAAAWCAHVHYCERFLELVVDLLAQLPTRRFVRLLLEDSHFLLRCRHSGLARRAPGVQSLYGNAVAAVAAVSSEARSKNRAALTAASSGLFGGAVLDDEDEAEGEADAAVFSARSASDAAPTAAFSGAVQSSGGARGGSGSGGRHFAQLLDMAVFLHDFEVDDQTGRALTDRDVEAAHYSRVATLQALAHRLFAAGSREMREFALGATGVVSQPRTLRAYLSVLDDAQLLRLAQNLRLLPQRAHYHSGSSLVAVDGAPALSFEPFVTRPPPSRRFVLAVLLAAHGRRRSQLRAINLLPLYPSEAVLWDASLLPPGGRRGGGGAGADEVLALPKLNLQFLTLYDYLLRSFHLYRLESAYEVRADLVDALRRVAPHCTPATASAASTAGQPPQLGRTVFTGWARTAVALEEGTGVQLRAVLPPRVGGEVAAAVSAELRFDLARFAPHIRSEWDALREHDVLFLVQVRSQVPVGQHPDGPGAGAGVGADGPVGRPLPDEEDFSFPSRFGVVAVRGCEVHEVLDEKGEAFGESLRLADAGAGVGAGPRARGNGAPAGTRRTLRVRLDPAQFHADVLAAGGTGTGSAAAAAPFYAGFNLVVRRDGRANNFRAILETIRDVMNSAAQGGAVPTWLHDVFLGYGDPAAAHFRSLPDGVRVDAADFCDTFVSARHVIESFPRAAAVVFQHEETGARLAEADAQPPFRLRFEALPMQPGADAGAGGAATVSHEPCERIVAIPYSVPPPGPFPEDVRRSSGVRFTPAQVEAVRAGLNPGLTLVVGPPGTGKTDTAVQIIASLYHNFPSQKVLLVTHSNAALNDVFEKLLRGTDVLPRHLLRLGAGERELDSAEDFSKAGRVQAVLERRMACLGEVERLGRSLAVAGDVAHTCETAGYFNTLHVKSRVDAFRRRFRLSAPPQATGLEHAPGSATSQDGATAQLRYRREVAARAAELAATAAATGAAASSAVAAAFPFSSFFASAPGGLGAIFRPGADALADLQAAEGCFRHLASLFDELAGVRAFELLRTQRARTDFMLVKQARVVAMTCTHASIMRQHFVALGFKYDSLVMEEAAQVLEVETLIPMLLQRPEAAPAGVGAAAGEWVAPAVTSRLKRVVLLGDHHQLPPVVQNAVLARYAGLDQSMFSRLVRLGAPAIVLRAQGRARPQLARLYSWRYEGLADLPLVTSAPQYLAANAGMALTHQLIDVGDFEGQGESAPSPHFYQNLGEAEYVVALFQYLRLCGVPAASIALLATYQGQVALLRDVVRRRCAAFAVFGEPAAVSTVDAFQGQQADFVLLSLVRTKAVGHLRDVRRLVVALSRARLGLYVFCRQALFGGCAELAPAFAQLARRPSALQLLVGESSPTPRTADADPRAAAAASGGLLTLVAVEGGVLQLGDIVQRILAAQRSTTGPRAPAPEALAPGDTGVGAGS